MQVSNNFTLSYGYEPPKNKTDNSKERYENIQYETFSTIDDLMNRREELGLKFNDDIPTDMNNFSKGLAVSNVIDRYTNNIELRNSLLQTVENMNNGFHSLMFTSEFDTNIADYYHGYDVKASFMVHTTDNNKIHSGEYLTNEQIKNVNINDFISDMISGFSSDLERVKSGEVKEQYQNILNGYGSLQENYKKEQQNNSIQLEYYKNKTTKSFGNIYA